ncbi:elongator complex protein 3 [Ammoniphilus sp. 3BR4]|uniref:elongator complex protein 3 n=1 Tax=Ammoniphilus sp. 3BR4 TaxID=3158265 RepID=UPI00346749A0
MIHRRIALFVPHQGCPKDCTFCNQSRITGQKREERLTEEQVRQTIEQHLATIAEGVYVEIAFFGGSFTGLPRSYQKMLLGVAKEYIDAGLVQGIRFSTRPDYIADHIMEFILPFGVTAIELGTQSLDDTVLELSQRGHTAAQVEKAVQIIRKYPQVQVGLQLLPGLPGDTKEIALQTTRQAISLQPDFVRIYPALVIAGTELERQYRTKQYTPLTVEEAVDMVASMWVLFMKANIPVIRIGLHSSEDLRSEGTIIAGPFHPSFRQLVEAELFHRLLKKIAEERPHGVERLVIHPADETAVRGLRGMNWKKFQQHYETLAPQLVLDPTAMRHEIQCIGKDGYSILYRLSSLESS